eukprot:264172-Prymnesium_polylepis.1
MDTFDAFATSAANAELPSWFYLAWSTDRLVALPKAIPADPAAAAAAFLNPSARPINIGEVDLTSILSDIVRQSMPVLCQPPPSTEVRLYLAPQQ